MKFRLVRTVGAGACLRYGAFQKHLSSHSLILKYIIFTYEIRWHFAHCAADTVTLPDGEEEKTMDVMMKIIDKALELGLDRKVTFVALGGGVIGDMVGFAAAIYQRGVNFIQVCGTVVLLVQVTCIVSSYSTLTLI